MPRTLEKIECRILTLRDQPVLLDVELARLHGVPRRRLRELTRQYYDYLPGELCFQPDPRELSSGCAHHDVDAFSECGVWVISTLLGTPAALERALEISRAFERYRRQTGSTRV
jgi:hypothetical protein